MILYFMDRNGSVIGSASTSLTSGVHIIDDSKTESVETAIPTLTATVLFDADNRAAVESYIQPGNGVLRYIEPSSDDNADISGPSTIRLGASVSDFNDYYTIVESETDILNGSIYFYAENGGLDLLNDMAPIMSASSEQYPEYYISKTLENTDFRLRNCYIPEEGLALSWDSSETVTARLNSIKEYFDCEYQFGFTISGLEITDRWLDVEKRFEEDTGKIFSINRELNNIVVRKSIANLATAVYPIGSNDITLDGYIYDDDDFFVDGGYIKSRVGLEKWARFGKGEGYIYKSITCLANNQADLFKEGLKRFKEIIEPELNYDVDISILPDDIKLGDRINIVDNAGEIYVSGRILELTTSISAMTKRATVGDYIIKTSGISDRVRQLAEEFKNIVIPEYDQVDVKLLSTTGTTIHRTSEYVELVATIFYNDEAISDKESLLSVFGENATLTWYRNGEAIESLLDYEQLLEDGFILHITYESYMASSNVYRVELFY